MICRPEHKGREAERRKEGERVRYGARGIGKEKTALGRIHQGNQLP